MKTIAELQADIKAHLAAAKGVCDAAVAAGRDLTAAERKMVDDNVAAVEQLKAEIARLESDPEEQKRRGDEALRKQIETLGEMMMGGQRGAGDGSPDRYGGKSWSNAFEKALPYQPRSGTKDLLSPNGAVSVPALSSTIVPLRDKVDTLLQLIPGEKMGTTDAFSYLQESVRVHAAATVAAGGVKPESTYTVERIDDRARVIAHVSEPIPRQYLADIPLLRGYIDGNLREGLMLALEDQIIAGDGDGENMTGILETSGILSQAWDTDILTTTRKAITNLDLRSIVPTGWAMYPTDWEAIELTVDLADRYQLSSPGGLLPVDRARRRLWGLPVALSLGVPEGTGILADFAGSTKLFEREAVRIDWSENVVNGEGVSDFVRNLVRFRCEGRWGFAVLRPHGCVEVDLAAGS